MALDQREQDRIWRHHQLHGTGVFDLSYPRLRYLADRCRAGSRVLNIGVGSGYLEELLASRGVEAYALDPSAETIERLRTRLHMGERARQGYAQHMPFDSGFFDKVILTEVLEHLPEDVLHPTLDEVRRVLEPEGALIGTVPFREDLQSNEVLCPRCETQFHRWGHAQSFDQASLGALLRQHGFRVERLYPRTFPDFRRRGARLFLKATFRYVLGRLGEPLVTPNLYFSARPAASASRKDG
jgi:SAM-dependent methyltransferase